MTGATFWMQRVPSRGLPTGGTGLRSRALFPADDPRVPEVYELTLAPGWFEHAHEDARRTFEHLTVVRGLLVVQTRGRGTRLGPGDALFFRADVPHSYRNPTSTETIVQVVLTDA